jgi:hypothetical protein
MDYVKLVSAVKGFDQLPRFMLGVFWWQHPQGPQGAIAPRF